MSSSYTPILMGVVSPVSEILLPSKTAKFPFLTMDYSPWSSKNLIDWNRLKKFKQVGIDVKFMHTNFDGCGLFGFGDTAFGDFFGDLPTKHAVVYEKLNLIELFFRVIFTCTCISSSPFPSSSSHTHITFTLLTFTIVIFT